MKAKKAQIAADSSARPVSRGAGAAGIIIKYFKTICYLHNYFCFFISQPCEPD